MKRFAILVSLLSATPALAQQPPATEMVLLPRAVAEAAAQWIAAPNAGNAVQLYASLTACIADNPQGGVVRHGGQDQCSTVTEALAAQAKQVADLTKERDALKVPKPDEPAK